MSISSKTRKNLWANSGNRCAICKKELFTNSHDQDKFNIGEECHIISSKPKGPRHKKLDEYDSYDNLILLCRNHHKEIDELEQTYTEDILRYLKLNHENWVKSTLEESISNSKKPKPRFLSRITSGKELLQIVSDSYGYRTDYDDVETEEEAQFIGGILQDLTDYGDISGMVETYDKVQMGLQLGEIIKLIEEKGYMIFGEKNAEKVKFGDGSMDTWSIATLVIKKKGSSEIVRFDENGKSA